MSLTGAVRAAVTKFDPYPGADLVLDWAARRGRQLFQRNGIIYPTLAAMIAAGAATFSRASAANLAVTGGIVPFASGEPRELPGVGFLPEEGRTNLFLNSFAPATQNVTLSATGNYAISVVGSGSVTVAAGTATITNGGAVTAGSPRTINCTGTGTISVTVTGSPTAVQVELGAFSTSIIATTGASASRAADNLSVPYSIPAGQDASGYAEVEFKKATGAVQYICQFDDGSNSNRIAIYRDAAGDIRILGVVAAANTISAAFPKPGARVAKVAWSRVGTTLALVVDGAAPVSITPAAMPTLSFARPGTAFGPTSSLNDPGRTVFNYPYAMSTAQMQALTA